MNNGECDYHVSCTEENGIVKCGRCPSGTHANGTTCICILHPPLTLLPASSSPALPLLILFSLLLSLTNLISTAYCGDKNCSEEFEDCVTCPHDCPVLTCSKYLMSLLFSPFVSLLPSFCISCIFFYYFLR